MSYCALIESKHLADVHLETSVARVQPRGGNALIVWSYQDEGGLFQTINSFHTCCRRYSWVLAIKKKKEFRCWCVSGRSWKNLNKCFTVFLLSMYKPRRIMQRECIYICVCVCVCARDGTCVSVCSHTCVWQLGVSPWHCGLGEKAWAAVPWVRPRVLLHVCACVLVRALVCCNRPVGRETDCVLTAIAVISNSCLLPILYSEGLCLHCLPHDLPSKTFWRDRERVRGGRGGWRRVRGGWKDKKKRDRERERWGEKRETDHWTVEKEK